MKNVQFWIGIGFISFMIGLAAGSVGEMPKNISPFDYTNVITVGIVTGLPFLLGFAAGLYERRS